jgi:Spy/CpxP family protein refolding chaperone
LQRARLQQITIGAVVAASCLVAAAAASPQTVKDSLEAGRQATESQRRILVSGALPLTDAEANAFWPLYDAYEKERRPLDEQANKVLADFLAEAATLTDAQAKALLEQELSLEEARLKVRRAYFGRMVRAIPARKVVRFFQIDNKLDTAVRADIARQVPLAP